MAILIGWVGGHLEQLVSGRLDQGVSGQFDQEHR